jgi:hypothetical protein
MVQIPESIHDIINGVEVPKRGAKEAYEAGYKNIADIGKGRIRTLTPLFIGNK